MFTVNSYIIHYPAYDNVYNIYIFHMLTFRKPTKFTYEVDISKVGWTRKGWGHI